MKRITTTSLFLLIIALGFLPFFVAQQVRDTLNLTLNLISSLSALITLVIAMVLYSKYGVEKSLIDKQTEVVLKLLSELKKTRFIFEWRNGLLQLRLDCLKDKYWQEYKDNNLCFDVAYMEGLKNLWDIADDLLLPTEIADKFMALKAFAITENQANNNDMRVKIPGYVSGEKQHIYGLLNGKTINLCEFVTKWSTLINSTIQWLKKHSSMSIDLNFEGS